MRDLPSGTVTFLFTEVEGSTRLLHEHGERYAELLAEHRQALREAFARHGGVEVDTQGDAFFVAFARASAAAAAAVDLQRALGAGDVRVRVGIHTGEPMVSEEGYVGMDVHRAARIARRRTAARSCCRRRRATSSVATCRCAISASTGSRTSSGQSGCSSSGKASFRR